MLIALCFVFSQLYSQQSQMTIQNNGKYITLTTPPRIYNSDKIRSIEDEEPPRTRYFFVSYYTPIRYGSELYIAVNGQLPSIKELTKEYHNSFPSDSIKDENYIVMGLFEFKSKKEAYDFFGFKDSINTIRRSGKKVVLTMPNCNGQHHQLFFEVETYPPCYHCTCGKELYFDIKTFQALEEKYGDTLDKVVTKYMLSGDWANGKRIIDSNIKQ